jgi:hypothetical protein
MIGIMLCALGFHPKPTIIEPSIMRSSGWKCVCARCGLQGWDHGDGVWRAY